MIYRTSKAEQNCQTQSGPKHRTKSSDLRRRLKAVSDVDEVTLDGRLFHWRSCDRKCAIANGGVDNTGSCLFQPE